MYIRCLLSFTPCRVLDRLLCHVLVELVCHDHADQARNTVQKAFVGTCQIASRWTWDGEAVGGLDIVLADNADGVRNRRVFVQTADDANIVAIREEE